MFKPIHTYEFQKLVKHINENDIILRSTLEKELKLYMCTCDTYRRKLEVVGFIKSIGRGKYKRVKQIPENYTTTQLRKDLEPFYNFSKV